MLVCVRLCECECVRLVEQCWLESAIHNNRGGSNKQLKSSAEIEHSGRVRTDIGTEWREANGKKTIINIYQHYFSQSNCNSFFIHSRMVNTMFIVTINIFCIMWTALLVCVCEYVCVCGLTECMLHSTHIIIFFGHNSWTAIKWYKFS